MHGNGHAGFGGRPAETDWRRRRHRAAGRPHTFRFASRKYWDQIAHDLRPVYTAASEAEALARFEEFEEKWAPRIRRSANCGARRGQSSCRSWTTANAIESINARYRRAIRARGHFPSGTTPI